MSPNVFNISENIANSRTPLPSPNIPPTVGLPENTTKGIPRMLQKDEKVVTTADSNKNHG